MDVQSFSAPTIEKAKSFIDDFVAKGFKPNLAIVFCSIQADLAKLQDMFNSYNIDLVGCSSAGEIHNQNISDKEIVCLLLDIDKNAYKIHASASTYEQTYQVSFMAGAAAKHTFNNPGILLLSGGVKVNAEKIVCGVKDGVGKEFPFYGGLAGDDLTLQATFAFTNNIITDNGIACLILDADRIEMTGMAISGWEAIGGVNTITKAEGNTLYSINDKPALDVFLKYFGFFDNTYHNDQPITTLSAQYPLQLMRGEGTNILRSPLFANHQEGSLTLAGEVKEGEKFRFSIAPGFEVTAQTVKEFDKMKEQAPDTDAVILFSCKGRHAALGPVMEEEIEGLYSHWRKPMIGFFSYGEIGNTHAGITEFHNNTCSLVLLKEKQIL